MPLSPNEIRVIRETFALVEPIAGKATELFYKRLFEIAPDTRRLFKGDMGAQGRKLMAALKALVDGLDRADQVLPVLERLGVSHRKYGVKEQHYDAVGAALLWTLSEGLGDRYDEAAANAWTGLYSIASNTMKFAAGY
jgi:nitric oxide dioxygenase